MKEAYAAGHIYIVHAVGNSQIGPRLQSLKNAPGMSGLKYLAVVRDAEKDAHGAKQSVRSAFRKADFCVVPQDPGKWYAPRPDELDQHEDWDDLSTGYLLFPTCDDRPVPGTLEDLALQTIADEKRNAYLDAARRYLGAVQVERGLEKYTEPHKNLLYAYLSGTNDAKGCKIGEAARAKIFDWDSPLYGHMKEFFGQALA
ncbi:MAG: hypothetical protein HDQ87_12030 [Clostridia bacterium]|nr:hypothetical protein [Clostridia bacterium]